VTKSNDKTRLSTVDIALMAVFCALFAVLNLTLGPLSFQLLQLPVLHDFAAFFPLLIIAWAVGRFGASSFVGIIGSIIAIFWGGPPLIICFAASAVIFDLLMSANRHAVRISIFSFTVVAISTMLSAYLAGVFIGIFFTPNQTLLWAITFWGGWHLVGGIVTLVITFPVILALENAGVRKIMGH
jgi:hypothetical protein